MSSLDATQYPTRLACFGESGYTNTSCTVPSQTMINFLNITSFDAYTDAYCLNPPQDSCAFGYCPNPDIASPAVRVATYVSNICFAIVILYSKKNKKSSKDNNVPSNDDNVSSKDEKAFSKHESASPEDENTPDDISSSFYAQVLLVYSLVISVIASIAEQQLTRLHAVFAIAAAGSPLSLYLLIYALRSMFHQVNRLDSVLGPGKFLNRTLILLIFPAWLAVLIFVCLDSQEFRFQQAACDAVFKDHLVGKFFYGPLLIFVDAPNPVIIAGISVLCAFVLSWLVCIFLQRKRIWKGAKRTFPVMRMWRKVIDRYPFIQFCTVIVIPMFLWIAVLEDGALFAQEHFVPTYGQLLGIFVAVPPLIQLIQLLPGLWPWFKELTWVRLLTGRRRKQPKRPTMPTMDTGLTRVGSEPELSYDDDVKGDETSKRNASSPDSGVYEIV